MRSQSLIVGILTTLILTTACSTTTTTTPAAAPVDTTTSAVTAETTAAPATPATPPAAAGPTAEEAERFVADAEARLAQLNIDQQRASWVQSTYITYDTQIISARENERLINAGVELAKQAARFDGWQVAGLGGHAASSFR